MKTFHLISKELAARWGVRETTLSQWRWFGKGPPFLKLGTLVLYRMKEIKRFEDLARQHLNNDSNHEVFSQIRLENKQEEQRRMSP